MQSKKEIKRIGQKGKGIKPKITTYQLQFIDSVRVMASSLSNLVDNLAEKIHKNKSEYGHDNKKCEECGIKNKVSAINSMQMFLL